MADKIKLTKSEGVFSLSMETTGGTFRTVGLELTDIFDRYKIKLVDQITENKMALESEELIKNDESFVFAEDIQRIQK